MSMHFVVAVIDADDKGQLGPVTCYGVQLDGSDDYLRPSHRTIQATKDGARRAVNMWIGEELSVGIITDAIHYAPAMRYDEQSGTPDICCDDVLHDMIHAAMSFAWPEQYSRQQRDKEGDKIAREGRMSSEMGTSLD